MNFFFKESKKKDGGQGQATIELLIAIVFSFGVFVMIFSVTLNITSGFIAHLATYYAGRAFLVADNGSNSEGATMEFSKSMGNMSFNQYRVQRFFIRDGNLGFNDLSSMNASRKHKLFVGAYYIFHQQLFTTLISPQKNLNMVSEAFLGKEPARYECFKRICETMKLKTGVDVCDQSAGGSYATLFDDGC